MLMFVMYSKYTVLINTEYRKNIKNTLSRYNEKLQSLDGTVNSRVQTYGNQVYQLYQAFLQNS